MVERRLYLILFALVLFVSVLHAERARNDHLQDDDEFDLNDDVDGDDEVIETIKRFLRGHTTTPKPSSDSIAGLVPNITPAPRLSTTTKTTKKPSRFGGLFKKKTTSTTTVASRIDRIKSTTSSPKDACGIISPCKNGGTCRTLSSGSYYCFCTQDYYGKTCENKFISTGSANNDRAKVDHCVKSPCLNGGECVGLRTTFYCRCKSPYYGITCDKKIGKREEIIDELNSAEEDLIAYERDLQDDNDDLRELISEQMME